MTGSTPAADPGRHLHFARDPKLWPAWPFLPLIRRTGGDIEYGVLFDALGACGRTGSGSTVFLTNLFTLPPTVDGLLALPKEVFDTPDEVVAAGWRVD